MTFEPTTAIFIQWNKFEFCPKSLRWRQNGRDGVSNQQPHDCLLNRLFGRIHRGLMNSPHKLPVTRKMFPFDDVIMWRPLTSFIILKRWWIVSLLLIAYQDALSPKSMRRLSLSISLITLCYWNIIDKMVPCIETEISIHKDWLMSVDIIYSSDVVSEWSTKFITRRHNERYGVSNPQPNDCLLNRLFKRRWKKHQRSASLAFVWGNHSTVENFSIWCRHHVGQGSPVTYFQTIADIGDWISIWARGVSFNYVDEVLSTARSE